MTVYLIRTKSRPMETASIACALGAVWLTHWPLAPCWTIAGAAYVAWVWLNGQTVSVDGKIVTLQGTIAGGQVGRAIHVDPSRDVRAVLFVLLPARRRPRAVRRIIFLRKGRVIAQTKDLPIHVEEPLLASIAKIARKRIRTIESRRTFRGWIR